MIITVFDVPEEEAIELTFDYENGMLQSFLLEDKQAEDLIFAIQNKINARI